MIGPLGLLIDAAALVLLLPVCVFSLEVLVAAGSRPGAPQRGERRRLAILIPAHNESSMIADTLRSLRPQLAPFDRLVVVADNCTDDTAAIAAAQGAVALERRDLARRGKGFALDFGVRYLARDPPEIVIVVDADCRVGPGSIDLLARTCYSSARPVQALYLMQAPANAGAKMRIAEFSWIVKNQVRPGGLHRLGLPCQLMGTGMAFPWRCLAGAELATGHIVEDLKLGIDLARGGSPPLFCPDALVASEFPQSADGAAAQRTRWEHGHLSVILSEAPPLFWQALRGMNLGLLALALDLSVPPVALLTLLVLAVWTVAGIYGVLTRNPVPFAIAAMSAVLLGLSVFVAWWRHGRRLIGFGDLIFGLSYALRKIPLYAKFLVMRQTSWIRSKRREED
jgi:cellulose synthase/poly-beta-1,6-N-acetylglucosamine synthase-like glycosyltransferase